jgi:tetratricopeptide (TPR) repeat protein
MLRLLRTPEWAAPDAPPPQVLPATLPSSLLVVLAVQCAGTDNWIDRESLVALFWPERPPAEGQHNLRVNLHRLRSQLAAWGQAGGLCGERTRLRLELSTDIPLLLRAVAQTDAHALLQTQPAGALQGLRIAGFDGFREWVDGQRARWLAAWQGACDTALAQGLNRADPSVLRELFHAWQDSGGQELPTVQRLDPSQLPAPALATWQYLCARLVRPASGGIGGHRDSAAPTAGASRASKSSARPQALPGRAAAQDALRASAAPAVVLLGEPGAGKTSLLTSCWPQAPLLHGREGLAGVPFAPLLEWLRAHRPHLRDAVREPATGLAAYRLDLARLLPELAPDEPLPPLDAHTAKSRLFEALARFFEAQGPVLLADDLQWFDAATLEWLVFGAHRQQQRWRASARTDKLAGPARLALDSLQAARLLQRQQLAPLDREGVAQACASRWPHHHFTPDIVAALHHNSGGNAFALGELVAEGAIERLGAGEVPPVPRRVQQLVGQRLQSLGPQARALVEAAAVLGSPAPLSLLQTLCDGLSDDQAWPACEQALAAELLHDEGGALRCRHDLIRSAAWAALAPARLQWLHRRAALALGAASGSEALIVAGHWEAACELPNALAWLYRGAAQQKARGRFDEARSLWQRVAQESTDSTLALKAQLALAECALFEDLAAGRQGLEQVLAETSAVADETQRQQIEAQALSGLIDNAVFSGDLPRAARLAPRLRELLPRLRSEDRVHACEVLIELAMREPDIDAAWALMEQVRRMAPRSPSTLSFEAQIHWFGGNARAARDAFEALLAAHPDYCSGLTIENDLAVMLFALGELARAEDLARRSLASWRGVPHTEALSLLVLGSVLTSAGRYDEADTVLGQALMLGREQKSALFEAEALVRRARLRQQCGRWVEAQADLGAAESLLRGSSDPLRVSQYAALRVVGDAVLGVRTEPALADRLRAISLRSVHPLLHARLARVDAWLALQDMQAQRAHEAAARGADIASQAGLLEPWAEALLLLAHTAQACGHAANTSEAAWRQAAAIADTQGFADIAWRAHRSLHLLVQGAAHAQAERDARRRLAGAARPALFDQRQALRRPA